MILKVDRKKQMVTWKTSVFLREKSDTEYDRQQLLHFCFIECSGIEYFKKQEICIILQV